MSWKVERGRKEKVGWRKDLLLRAMKVVKGGGGMAERGGTRSNARDL